MALGFYPPFTKEVIIMTDFEVMSLIIMMVMLVFEILGFCKHK